MKKEKVYFQSKLKISFGERSMSLHAYISPFGAARVIRAENITSDILYFFGKEIDVQIKANLVVKGCFLIEKTADGNFFNIRFSQVSAEQRNELKKDVEEKGEIVSWARKHPRIHVSNSVPGAPEPILAILHSKSGSQMMSIMDYTLEGIKLQFDGENPPDLKIGEMILFDILTSDSDNIKNIHGEVRHIMQDNIDATGLAKNMVLGIKITKMTPSAEKLYRDLILKYCLALKEQFKK